jgi:hypothetical protein
MRIIGCDLHARQQTIAMLDTDTGELEEKTLEHEGETVREFYSALSGPILVGIEATGSMQWFLEMMEELGSNAAWAIPRRSARRRHGSKSMIGGMRDCCSRCSPRIAFQRSGCPRPSNAICAHCYVTVISECACEAESSTPCNR